MEREHAQGHRPAYVNRVTPLTMQADESPHLCVQKMHALVDAWAQEIDGYPVGCLELHYAVEQVKAVLKVSVGQKKL